MAEDLRRSMPGWGLLASLLIATGAGAQEAVTPWSAANGSEPPAPWRVAGLPEQSKPFTTFTVERQGGVALLRIEAAKSYGNLVHPLTASRDFHRLAWTWQVDEPLPKADLSRRTGEDMPVRVCVMYDMPTDKLGLLERSVLASLGKNAQGKVPSATVCYVWDSKLAPGTVLRSPFTDRMGFYVLRGPESAAGRQQSESRDIGADFMRVFGEETHEVPPVIAVGVGADSDNTEGHSVARVGSLKLTR